MSRRQSFLAYAALIVGVISFVGSFARPLIGQQAAPEKPVVGRFQMTACGLAGASVVYVIDTSTGKIWQTWKSGNDPVEDWVEVKPLPISK